MLKGAVAPVSRGDASCRTPTRHAVRWFRLSLRCSRRFMYREVCFSTARYELHSCHSLHSPCTLPVIPFVYRASGEWREWNGGACGASGTVGARGTDGLAPPHADILFPLQGTLNQNPALLFDVCHEDRWSLPDDIRWHKPRSAWKIQRSCRARCRGWELEPAAKSHMRYKHVDTQCWELRSNFGYSEDSSSPGSRFAGSA